MSRYIVRRLLWLLFVLWGVSLITFGATFISPIDPARVYAGLRASPEVIEQIRHEFGLDQPLHIQYGRYVWRILHGDLGRSYHNSEPVLRIILRRLPATAELALAGVIVQFLIGIPVGIVSAIRHRSLVDRTTLLLSLLGIVTPVFVLGLLLLYVFAYRLGVFPIGGRGNLQHLVLPALALGVTGGAWYARMLRSNMLDILGQGYVRTARAKGLRERAVILRHVLKNAVGPIIAMIGMDIGKFFGGVLVIEKVFAWPGLGSQTWQAIGYNDIPMIMGIVLFTAFAITVMNVVADVANAWIDPRIRYD